MARNDKSVNTKVGTVRKVFWAFSAIFFSCFFFIIFNAMREVRWPETPTPAPAPVAKAEPKPMVEPEPEPEPVQPEPPVVRRKWYEGGTLHKKSALDWQVADYDDKLATCADWVANVWTRKAFIPEIQSSITQIDDLKPYAMELVVALNAATKKDPNDKRNRQLFENQPIQELAAACMIIMKWYK